MNTNTPPQLPADLEAGLRRLKLAAIRAHGPEILLTAKTQRWTPEETLRVLIDTEIAARDASNMASRMKAARFPIAKTLDGFYLDESSIPRSTHDYLITLDWIPSADNLCLIGPPGTGKTHYLIALARAAVQAGHRVRYYTAIELVEALWRGHADNTIGRTIEQVCRNDLIVIDLCRPRDYPEPVVMGRRGAGRTVCGCRDSCGGRAFRSRGVLPRRRRRRRWQEPDDGRAGWARSSSRIDRSCWDWATRR